MGWVVNVTSRPHYRRVKDPVTIVKEDGWTPETVWTGSENLDPIGIRSPAPTTRSRPTLQRPQKHSTSKFARPSDMEWGQFECWIRFLLSLIFNRAPIETKSSKICNSLQGCVQISVVLFISVMKEAMLRADPSSKESCQTAYHLKKV